MTRKILIDGNEISAERIEVIYEDVPIFGEDEPGSLHVNLTHEGVVIDVWGISSETGEETNFGSQSQTVEEISEQLCEENA